MLPITCVLQHVMTQPLTPDQLPDREHGFRSAPAMRSWSNPGTLMETKMVLRSLQRRLQVDFELLRWPSEPKKLSTTHYLLFISWFLSPLAS